MAGEPVFVDTNVLVHASRERSPFHAPATACLRHASNEGTPLWLSRQILREYLAVVTRPQPSEPAWPTVAAVADVRSLLSRFNVAEDGPRVTETLLQLLANYPSGGKQIHDANIAATMQAHGIRHLLTFNIADFRRFAGLIELIAP